MTRSMFVEADLTRHWVSQKNDQYKGSGANLFFQDTLGSGWEGKLGVGLIDYEGTRTTLSYLASLAFQPSRTSHLTLAYEYDNVVYKVSRLDPLKENIVSHEFSSPFYLWISESWSFWGRCSLGRYSDRNLRTSLDASLTYMFRLDPAFSLTYAFYYLSYKERSRLYWDPRCYQSHLLILRLEEKVRSLVSVELRGSVGFSASEKRRTNPGLSIRLALPHSPRWGLDLTGEYIGDGSRGPYYSYTTTSVNIFYLLSRGN